MRVVLDANVLIAALIAHGTCHEVLERCIYHHELIGSAVLLQELRQVLMRKFGYTKAEAMEAERLMGSRMTLVEPRPLDIPVCRDPDDDLILGTAMAGNCRCLVTGDQDLLLLDRYCGIAILSPSGFWKYERNT
jgi:putative PIN family toxin of toxin-antitoxin system